MTRISAQRQDYLLLAALTAGLALLPLTGQSNYVLGQATLYLIWAAVVSQWNLVLGVAGIMSIGNLALFAAGGYAVALLGLYHGVSPWASLPVAALAGLVMALLMGLATLRLRGAYTVVVTLAIAMVMYQLIVTDVDCFRRTPSACYSLTGGARGLTRFGDFGFNDIFGYGAAAWGNFLLALAVLAACMAAAITVVHSPYGRAFQALRDNEQVARARGIRVEKFQLIVFAAAGLFTGLAGAVYAGTQRTFGPQVLGFPTLLFLLSIMIVGGRGRVWGPVLGTLCLALVQENLTSMAQWQGTIYAVLLILILILAPEGLAGGLSRLAALVRARLKGGAA
ncbi:branched-chain amino acid ABC transporter permease [Ruixingdingia sedimenti]|uniref:Branched-chain amino acid ABC transporter permease n=1 Tax=Ruixingdingia sedimenti TaxID=3073604 RepID=A0ABU1FE97_9RHOB|nr:branched-chain amino acid ABC transporter permease [Xinfangfangia sp. LG-4]MDR5655212.1 branched-chain amino acid ABC transporter permease [Xinfangfangia sp. LG-4]